jgi:hypothetical protein
MLSSMLKWCYGHATSTEWANSWLANSLFDVMQSVSCGHRFRATPRRARCVRVVSLPLVNVDDIIEDFEPSVIQTVLVELPLSFRGPSSGVFNVGCVHLCQGACCPMLRRVAPEDLQRDWPLETERADHLSRLRVAPEFDVQPDIGVQCLLRFPWMRRRTTLSGSCRFASSRSRSRSRSIFACSSGVESRARYFACSTWKRSARPGAMKPLQRQPGRAWWLSIPSRPTLCGQPQAHSFKDGKLLHRLNRSTRRANRTNPGASSPRVCYVRVAGCTSFGPGSPNGGNPLQALITPRSVIDLLLQTEQFAKRSSICETPQSRQYPRRACRQTSSSG